MNLEPLSAPTCYKQWYVPGPSQQLQLCPHPSQPSRKPLRHSFHTWKAAITVGRLVPHSRQLGPFRQEPKPGMFHFNLFIFDLNRFCFCFILLVCWPWYAACGILVREFSRQDLINVLDPRWNLQSETAIKKPGCFLVAQVVKTLHVQCKECGFDSLVGEIRSHVPRGVAKMSKELLKCSINFISNLVGS